ETQQLAVIRNSPDEIQIREAVVVTPRFVDMNGKDITTGGEVAREVVIWTLRLENDLWLIHDAVVTSSKPAR
ncbi:MAG TPA: hypothetical protein VNA87_05135, partial [Actinomycetota bacterium]|nr:hypothetical protein [Actinomycetota bacterium]